MDDLFEKIDAVMDKVNSINYPETYDYLYYLLSSDFDIPVNEPTDIAYKLLELDKPKKLSSHVIGLITELLKDGFANGNYDAMCDLGILYFTGRRGFKKSDEAAFQCYTLAAQKGSTVAQNNLGYCYYYGKTVPVDYEKAFYYYSLGAFKGMATSLYKIGDMYLNGYYIEKNEMEAFAIYNHCLELMDDEEANVTAGPIFLRLGKCYLNGAGVDVDYKAALICLQKAESFLWDMVLSGNEIYRGDLQSAIEHQKIARKKLGVSNDL